MGALKSVKFGKIRPRTIELAAFERLKKKSPYTFNGKNGVVTFFSAVFDRILFILGGNDVIHKSLDEFEIRPDPTRTTELPALERQRIDVATFISCFSSDPYMQ